MPRKEEAGSPAASARLDGALWEWSRDPESGAQGPWQARGEKQTKAPPFARPVGSSPLPSPLVLTWPRSGSGQVGAECGGPEGYFNAGLTVI